MNLYLLWLELVGEVESAGEGLFTEGHDVGGLRQVPLLVTPHGAGRTEPRLNLVHDEVRVVLEEKTSCEFKGKQN